MYKRFENNCYSKRERSNLNNEKRVACHATPTNKCEIQIKKFKQNSAITLIALVITIIVLLILAAITLNMVLGENGIFGKARNSKAEMEYAQELESLKLAVLDAKAGDASASYEELFESLRNDKNYTYIINLERKNANINSAKGIQNIDSIPNEQDIIYVIPKDYEFGIDRNLNIIEYDKKAITGNNEQEEQEIINPTGMLSETQYKINNTTLTFNKIVAVGENEELKTIKQAFDYLCDNELKEDCAILLRSGFHDTADLFTGYSYNINGNYNGMSVAIIGDVPGETYMAPGELQMAQVNNTYGIKLKFYRIVFKAGKNGVYSDAGNSGFNLGGDNKTNEYYNCVFIPAIGGWNGQYSEAKINTYNCTFLGGANGFYSGNPLNGIAQNCASKDTTIDPYNGTKTTCLTNASFDEEYNITSQGWENTGTGTNPDGTQANIGVYGGEFAWPFIDYSNEIDYANNKISISFNSNVQQVKFIKGNADEDSVLNNGAKLNIRNNTATINNMDIGSKYTLVLITKNGDKILKRVYISGMISDTQYKINNTTLTFNKIVAVGKNENLKTIKQGFDYLCDNNYKENAAIVLREGSYDTQNLHAGTSYNILSKYNGMKISIIGDNPGNTFMTSGEMMLCENNENYQTELKFYRIIFKTPVYTDDSEKGMSLGGDKGKNEYYNCVFTTKIGGWNGKYSNAEIGTYNCLFTGGVCSVYSSYPLKGESINSVSTDSNIDPCNGTKTTCLTNASFDEEYNITSQGWENTGTGTNPDGTQANIGVYGGEFSW